VQRAGSGPISIFTAFASVDGGALVEGWQLFGAASLFSAAAE